MATLLVLTGLFLLLALVGAVLELWLALRERWRHLPAPDDPRLRNVEGILEWRRKRKPRRWIA